jgi:hypothetical protein
MNFDSDTNYNNDSEEEDDRKMAAEEYVSIAEEVEEYVSIAEEVERSYALTAKKNREEKKKTMEHGCILVSTKSIVEYKHMIKHVAPPEYYAVLQDLRGIHNVEVAILEHRDARSGIRDMAFVNAAMLDFMVALKLDFIGKYNTGIIELIQQVFSK